MVPKIKNYFGSEKNFGPEKMKVKKNLGFEKILDSKKILGPKRNWAKKKFGSEKILGPKFLFLFLFFL